MERTTKRPKVNAEEKDFARAPVPNHPEAEYDEVRIFRKIRYKTSDLSGDEWRTSCALQYRNKGVVLKEVSAYNVDTGWFELMERDAPSSFPDRSRYESLCDQTGCSAEATVTYRLKNGYYDQEKQEWVKKSPRGRPFIRRFCHAHSKRGDCSLDDSDTNYELIESAESPLEEVTDPSVISPSGFGGVVFESAN